MPARDQAGVIPFRHKRNGIEICLIRDKGGKKWKIPKGFVDSGETVRQTALKEAWEEAGIPTELARRAVARGTVNVLREVPEGVQSEIVSIYDLELPEGWLPQNQDGEVSEFRLLTFSEVECEVLTFEAALVARHYLNRRPARAP